MAVQPPIAPFSFYVQQANNQVLVSYSLVPGATSYNIQRSTDGIVFTDLATAISSSYLDTSVTPGLQYYYQVASQVTVSMVVYTGQYTAPQAVVPVGSGEMTLGQLRLLSQQKADRVNSQFVTLPEWNVYINQSYFELYDLLVQKYGDTYYMAPPLQINTTGVAFYDLPNGINYEGAPPLYKMLGVDVGVAPNDSSYTSAKRFNFIDRNRYVYPQLTTNLLYAPQYRIMGSQIEFIPNPASGQFVRLWYVPRMLALLQDTDIADGVSGWTEYIAVDAAIKALQKEESDVTVLALQKQALIQRIESAAENRDIGQPDTISDTRRATGFNGWGGGGDWGGPIGGI